MIELGQTTAHNQRSEIGDSPLNKNATGKKAGDFFKPPQKACQHEMKLLPGKHKGHGFWPRPFQKPSARKPADFSAVLPSVFKLTPKNTEDCTFGQIFVLYYFLLIATISTDISS